MSKPDNTQELDELLLEFAGGYFMSTSGERHLKRKQTKQAIIDWHNKQIEEVLDRLCSDDKMYWDGACVNYLVRKSAIETERTRLNPSKSTPFNKIKEAEL